MTPSGEIAHESDSAKKTDRRIVRTRKAIMEAFDRLVVKCGIDKITVSAVAREADIDRKTFYLHYRSINDLVNYKTEQSLEYILARLKQRGEGKTPHERIHIVLEEVNDSLMSNIDMYEHIASSLSIEQILGHFEEAIQPTLESVGVDTSVLAGDTELHMRLQFYLAGALSLYSTWLTSDHSIPIESVSSTIERAITSPTFPTLDLI